MFMGLTSYFLISDTAFFMDDSESGWLDSQAYKSTGKYEWTSCVALRRWEEMREGQSRWYVNNTKR